MIMSVIITVGYYYNDILYNNLSVFCLSANMPTYKMYYVLINWKIS